MLKKLIVRNYALIDDITIELPEGLVIITGETGAGKSILIGALSLLLGAKGEASLLKDPSENCVVEGEFGGEHSIYVRRLISPNGRSRAFIDDEPVTLNRLSEFTGELLDIHSQNNQLLLAKQGYRLSVVDYFASDGELLSEYDEVFAKLSSKRTELKKLAEKNERNRRDLEYDRYQFEKLSAVDLSASKLEEMEERQKKLANAEDIKQAVASSLSLLRPGGESLTSNLKEVSSVLKKYARFEQEFEGLAERLESCRIECRDIEEELEHVMENISFSPQELEKLDDDIGAVYSLLRKFGTDSVDGLISMRDSLKVKIDGAGDNEEHQNDLQKEIAVLENRRNELASELSGKRKACAGELGRKLEKEIRELNMPRAVFDIEIGETSDFTESGKDEAKFLFSANGRGSETDIEKVASGGELSRVMLCVKALMAKYTGMPTMVLDEIDTGVSGSVADRMGRLIDEMGKSMQMIVITHLPQIASKGAHHFLVYKNYEKSSARTGIKLLDKEGRVMEIARMLSGSELSDAAINNARDLLKNNIKI
ncbi:MAG: DNA repair protein RecN [Bacteroidales bacterium]|jgi:DNA repair protein RecN (Recombination protein N)|nr:DNA repair protein RecN [Bacteroidales bacterium]